MINNEDNLTPEEAEIVLGYVLEHYIKHYNVVMMKLSHAKSATKQSIQEIKAANQNEKDVRAIPELEEIHAYDDMWEQVIKLFRNSGVSEEELEKIEDILSRIPRLIKKYYDLLVEQDKVLQELVRELDAPEYRRALAITRKMQERKDMLSGLDPTEFEIEADESASAFMFKVKSLKGAKK